MIEAAARITANSITHALRGPWRLNGFDARGNHAGPTSPFRLTARAPTKPPSVFIERFIWGVTDPDHELGVPPLSWLIHQATYLETVARFGIPDQSDWRWLLNNTHQAPFRRARNRHGNAKYRRNEDASSEAARIALAIAASATVQTIAGHTYREAFPLDPSLRMPYTDSCGRS